MIFAEPCEQVFEFFVWFAHLEFYHKQSQELWCIGTVVVDGSLDGFLESGEDVLGGEEAKA